jgi:hypothetical protein
MIAMMARAPRISPTIALADVFFLDPAMGAGVTVTEAEEVDSEDRLWFNSFWV